MNYKNSQELFEHFQKFWLNDNRYYVWGTGSTAEEFCACLSGELDIAGFVDNDSEKWGKTFHGYRVSDPKSVLADMNGAQLIIASQAYNEIAGGLTKAGLVEDVDFCSSHYFLSSYMWCRWKKVYIRRTDISITSFCNLKCKDCNMLMPYYKKKRHYDSEEIISSIDNFFKWADHLSTLKILGGEPFLHPNVYKICRHIAENYRDRISVPEIFSNGTIMPDERLLALIKEYDLSVYIGDYRKVSDTVREKVERFVEALERHGIRYSLPPDESWSDFNHTETDRSEWTGEQLAAVCKACGEPFRGLHGSRFYFCHLNASADLAGLYPAAEDDYFDLSANEDDLRCDLVAYDIACLPKKYVSYCRHCAGCPPMNRSVIPVAEQIF